MRSITRRCAERLAGSTVPKNSMSTAQLFRAATDDNRRDLPDTRLRQHIARELPGVEMDRLILLPSVRRDHKRTRWPDQPVRRVQVDDWPAGASPPALIAQRDLATQLLDMRRWSETSGRPATGSQYGRVCRCAGRVQVRWAMTTGDPLKAGGSLRGRPRPRGAMGQSLTDRRHRRGEGQRPRPSTLRRPGGLPS